jgi:hypothetical protein
VRYPQVVVCAFDNWVADQLRELAAEHRWLLRDLRQPGAALGLVGDGRPTVLVVQADPTSDRPDPLRLVATAHRQNPDHAIVVVSDAKLGEDDRAGWTAAVLDLGARYVLFPPLTRPVIEDVVSGLMTAVVRRVTGTEPGPPVPDAGPIDLALEGNEDD